MTTEQYNAVKPFEGILDLFERTGEYIGGADELFDKSEMLFGGKIDKSCNDCKVGFFKFLISQKKKYEKTIN